MCLDPDPWIRIFLRIRIRIQRAKIMRIQRIRIRIRILSTAFWFLLKNVFIFPNTANEIAKTSGRVWKRRLQWCFIKYTPLYVQMYCALYCLNLCIFRVMSLLYVDNCLHVDLAILGYREYNQRCYCTIIAVNIFKVFFWYF